MDGKTRWNFEGNLYSLKVFPHKFLLITNVIIIIVINHNYGGDLEDTILSKWSTYIVLILT